MILGDLFSDDFKEKFANKKIDFGTTLLIHIADFDILHDKYAIIIGSDEDTVAMVIINTEINPNVFYNKFLQSQHLPIPVLDHNFLSYDSFIDCSKIQKKPQIEVLNFIKNNPSKVYNIAEYICEQIKLKIADSPLISKAEKKIFGFL